MLYGLCECGCGQETRISKQNHAAKGWVKDQPFRFVAGHQRIKAVPGYMAMHEWVRKHHPKTGICVGCGPAPSTEYALIHGHEYSRDVNDYQEMCHRCHVRYDYAGRGGARNRLTEEDVREIRRRWAAGETPVQLGRIYGVSDQNIWHVVKRRTWKWVEAD